MRALFMVRSFSTLFFSIGLGWLWILPPAFDVMELAKLPQFYEPLQPYSFLLTSAQNQPTGDETYSYDAAGNRLSSADEPGTWQYDDNNALVGKGDYTFDYDENGNRILRQLGGELIHYHYDVLNQLTRIEDQNGQVLAEYGYDLFGRRIWKQVDGVRTWFYYTDEGLAAELDGSGAVTRSYGFHPHSFGSSNPLFVKQGEQYYWILNDASGFPVRVVQPDGGVVWAGQHDSFGEVTVDYEALNYPFRFPGQYYDQESDLYYNWHRYYDPDTGRYLSWDPAEDGSNHYLYVENNPTIYVDPDGQKLIWWALTTFTPQGRLIKAAGSMCRFLKHAKRAKKMMDGSKKAKRCSGNGYCFAAGTLVQTSEGLVSIEEIEVGDLVLSFNTNTQENSFQAIQQISKRPDNEIIQLSIQDETIKTTPEHPFWVVDQGWVTANCLEVGDQLFNGKNSIPLLEISQVSTSVVVYNFEVEKFHTYSVSGFGLWVHNNCSPNRRNATSGDYDFPSERAARRAAFRDQNIPNSRGGKPFSREKSKNGETIKTKDKDSREDVEIDHHKDGHDFKDDNTYEKPHYHSKKGAHLCY
jgi:RHS repeat-associated protein